VNEADCSLTSLCGGYFCATGDFCTASSVWCCASPYPNNAYPYQSCYAVGPTARDNDDGMSGHLTIQPEIFNTLFHFDLMRCMTDVDAAQRRSRTNAQQLRKIEANQRNSVHKQNDANVEIWSLVAAVSAISLAVLVVLWAPGDLLPGHGECGKQRKKKSSVYEDEEQLLPEP